MTVQSNFNANRKLSSDDDITISETEGEVYVDPPEKRFHLPHTPRAVWTAPFEFVLDFGKMGNSPVGNGKYLFEAKPYQGGWRVAIMLKDVVYDTKLKYDVITPYGTLDPAIIIDPN